MTSLLTYAALFTMTAAIPRADEPTAKELAERIAQLEKRAFDSEKKVDALADKLKNVDGKLDAILAAVSGKPAAPVVTAQPVARPATAVGVRAPIGHTHTCANGHTWDHSANPSHNCTFPVPDGRGGYRPCGLFQNTQDSVPRPVTLAAGDAFAGNPAPPPPYYGSQSAQSSYSFQSASGYSIGSGAGGCANGQCTSGGYQFAPVRGLFSRLRNR